MIWRILGGDVIDDVEGHVDLAAAVHELNGDGEREIAYVPNHNAERLMSLCDHLVKDFRKITEKYQGLNKPESI